MARGKDSCQVLPNLQRICSINWQMLNFDIHHDHVLAPHPAGEIMFKAMLGDSSQFGIISTTRGIDNHARDRNGWLVDSNSIHLLFDLRWLYSWLGNQLEADHKKLAYDNRASECRHFKENLLLWYYMSYFFCCLSETILNLPAKLQLASQQNEIRDEKPRWGIRQQLE